MSYWLLVPQVLEIQYFLEYNNETYLQITTLNTPSVFWDKIIGNSSISNY
jgi:hypothetical protein